LFLTTNRVDCLDEAFSSRISIALYYPVLDRTARVEVWKNFLVESANRSSNRPTKSKSSRKPTAKKSDFDFEALSNFEINGRQIRSCVKMARALANSEKVPLAQSHLLQTIQLTMDFSKQFGLGMEFQASKRLPPVKGDGSASGDDSS